MKDIKVLFTFRQQPVMLEPFFSVSQSGLERDIHRHSFLESPICCRIVELESESAGQHCSVLFVVHFFANELLGIIPDKISEYRSPIRMM